MKENLRYVAVMASLLLCSCASSVYETPPNHVAMGVALPFSGKRSEYAENIKRGMELAKEEINAQVKNGQKLSIIYADTKGDPAETGPIIQKFVKANVKVMHVGFTNDFAYDLNILGLLKDTLVNYLCTYPPAAVHSPNSVRIFLNGAQECEMMAKLVIVPSDEERKLVIMGVSDASGKSCSDYLKFQIENPRLKIMSDSFKDGEQRFDIFADQISLIGADYVILYGYGDTAAPMLESLKDKKFEGTFISNCGLIPHDLKSTETIRAYSLKTAFELGKVFTGANKKFTESYLKKYGVKPHFTAAYGYDSIMLTWNALKDSNFDAKTAREALLDKTFEAAVGKIAIDKLGDTNSELEMVLH